ncbi:stalk domain-containing protein [Paenibacillus sp. P46E]|uniref:stalk domain-containing protein n=1 Tax=Paenibacillus sp. P46E TaxID=1349436 RepID=UPI00093D7CE5|nr:stalk domain-containing protein [Paenibacillus sp. P46E]OKP95042.1 hypothetical protein A3849_28075 [Paenibacillus sp. P46E]
MRGYKLGIAVAVIAVALLGNFSKAEAAGATLVDFEDGNRLMSDGTVWTQDMNVEETLLTDYNIVDLDGEYGLTKDGQLVRFSLFDAKVVKGTSGIVQISGTYYLKQDGTVWDMDGKQLKEYSDIAMINANRHTNILVTLSRSGELRCAYGFQGPIDQLGSASEVSAVLSGDLNEAAVVLKSGKVLVYSKYQADKANPAKYVPTMLTEQAAGALYNDSGNLFVLLQDGTIVVKRSQAPGTYELEQTESQPGHVTALVTEWRGSLIIKLQDGTLRSYSPQSGELQEISVPVIEDLNLRIESKELKVGSKVSVQIDEIWSNDTTKRIPLSEAELEIEKPYLLQKMPDGTVKALAVGQTKLTARSGSFSKTISVSISDTSLMDQGAYIGGTMYLPVQPVFHKLGASIQTDMAAKTFSIRLGELPIQLQLGSDTAIINGEKVKMSDKVQTVNGTAIFPASLLKTALGAGLAWDGTYQKMTVSFGSAKLTVQTKQTAQIVKTKSQGYLTKLIGKSYWVNFFDENYRFQKVTIVDIIPNNNGYFAAAFKFPSGKVLNTRKMSGDELISTLADRQEFFTADPYKTYKWPDAIWAKIKDGRVTTGMTKQQVELSWGSPIDASAMEGSGVRVETWSYGNFNYVTFTNGVVTMIYTN